MAGISGFESNCESAASAGVEEDLVVRYFVRSLITCLSWSSQPVFLSPFLFSKNYLVLLQINHRQKRIRVTFHSVHFHRRAERGL
jgi:hypothetical protein